MTMPNFLIIGSAKSGTTSLYHYLSQHPQIYMSPVKEPRFFALEGNNMGFGGLGDQEVFCRSSVTNIEDYQALFQGVKNEKAIGEASNLYIYDPDAPKRIHDSLPRVKLIAVLRNPVDRAYSNYLYLRRKGEEPLRDFAEALAEEPKRISENWIHIWHYKQQGFYYQQLKRYFDLFDRSQIRIYLYDDLEKKTTNTLQDIFHFLGVDSGFVPSTDVKYNISGLPKNKSLHSFLSERHAIKDIFKLFIPRKLLKRIAIEVRNLNLTKPVLSQDLRDLLIAEYQVDILKLQNLINRDLSDWLLTVKS